MAEHGASATGIVIGHAQNLLVQTEHGRGGKLLPTHSTPNTSMATIRELLAPAPACALTALARSGLFQDMEERHTTRRSWTPRTAGAAHAGTEALSVRSRVASSDG